MQSLISKTNQHWSAYLSHKGLRKKEHGKEAKAKNNGHDTGREKEKLTATY